MSYPDSKGLTPIMHAVRCNDWEIVQLLQFHNPDLELRDHDGLTVFHHLISVQEANEPVITYDNAIVFSTLASGNNKRIVQDHASTLYKMAIQAKAYSIANELAKKFDQKSAQFAFSPWDDVVANYGIPDFDVSEDAQEMLEILEKEAEMKQSLNAEDEEEKPSPHCEVNDGELFKDYSILMTKVDVANGAWGMYNFYRMQIWKEKNKDLYILFTNWGRIGGYHAGQYQNTPFGSEDQAVQEFHKIFKSKTGNEWGRFNFENKKGKYRLVEKDTAKRIKKKALVFDLESKIPSKLPLELQTMLKDMASVSMYVKAYKEIGIDYEAVPFGRIKKDDLLKALDIIQKLKPLIKTKDKLTEKRDKIDIFKKEKLAEANSELTTVVEEIVNLSTEYYYLMPKQRYEFTRLQPLDADYHFEQEENRVNNMLEFEVAERFLLGAQFRKGSINPLDYIYSAMKCSIQVVKENDSEAVSHILRYIYRSRGFANSDVAQIFKVQITADADKPQVSIGKGHSTVSRQLLWHGTKPENLLSILNKGLLVNAPFVDRTGNM